MYLLSPDFSILVWTLFLLFIPGVLIFCLYRERRLMPKIVWSLLIVFLPFVGGFIYLLNVLVDTFRKSTQSA